MKIVLVAGSTRKGSYNKQLIDLCFTLLKSKPLEIQIIDLNDYPLPIYNNDLENKEGIPENAMKLNIIFKESAGIIISSPEYNSSVSPLLKNVIDWVSRIKNKAFRYKIVALVSASPGTWGGIRNLTHLRSIMNHLGSIVVPYQFCLPGAAKAFTEIGELIEDKNLKALQTVLDDFVMLVMSKIVT